MIEQRRVVGAGGREDDFFGLLDVLAQLLLDVDVSIDDVVEYGVQDGHRSVLEQVLFTFESSTDVDERARVAEADGEHVRATDEDRDLAGLDVARLFDVPQGLEYDEGHPSPSHR